MKLAWPCIGPGHQWEFADKPRHMLLGPRTAGCIVIIFVIIADDPAAAVLDLALNRSTRLQWPTVVRGVWTAHMRADQRLLSSVASSEVPTQLPGTVLNDQGL